MCFFNPDCSFAYLVCVSSFDIEVSQITDNNIYNNNIFSYSQGSVVVDSELIFNNVSSVPETSVVANVLVEAASNSSNFSLPLNVSSIVATSKSCFMCCVLSLLRNTVCGAASITTSKAPANATTI